MKRGPQSAKLSFEQITVLRKIQSREREGIPGLARHMKAPFKWQTLSQALRGRPIRLINHQFIVGWLDAQTTETGDSRTAQVPAVRGRSR